MKIICDNCRTKYSIADEKVKGKVFKIRCKKCQNIIVVRGNEGAAAAESSGTGSGVDFAGVDQGEAPVWHLVIGREQVGPMTPSEVRDRFARGEIDADTYIWREGFADWMRLSAVEDFADIAQSTAVAPQPQPSPAYNAPAAAAWSAAPAAEAPAAWQAPQEDQAWRAGGQGEDTARADSANLFGGNLADPGKDLFGSQSGHDAASEFASPAAAPSGDLFRAPAPAPAAAGGGDIFGGPGGNGGQQLFPSEDKADSGGVQMTGQRHENSVLFSLTNLQALAMGGKPSPSVAVSGGGGGGGGGAGGDGSGLIDIRAMATVPSKATAASGGLDELPDLGGFAAPMAAAPVLLPAVVEERPKWVLPLIIGVGATLVLSVVVLTVVLVLRKPEVQLQQVAANIPPVQPKVEPKPEPKPEAKTDTKDTKADTKAEDDVGKKVGRKGKGKGKGKVKGVRVAAADPDPSPAPAGKSKGGGSKKRDDLDALIDGAIGGGGSKKAAAPKPKAAAAADANLPETLGRGEIVNGMKSVKGRVQGCFDKYRVPGMANVTLTVARSGAVSGAKVKGIFAGTPTGACIQAAVRSATFSRFRGSPVTFDYPFILR
jgi:predicted Zn finger-like uncharacterized protein